MEVDLAGDAHLSGISVAVPSVFLTGICEASELRHGVRVCRWLRRVVHIISR